MALVEEELGGRKAGKDGLVVDSLLEGLERLAAALTFGAGEGDVGMEGTGLGDESAGSGSGHDASGERDEFGSGGYITEEDAGTVENSQLSEMDGDGGGVHLGEMRDEALVLFRTGVAQELEGDVPGGGFCPAEAVVFGSEPGYDGR